MHEQFVEPTKQYADIIIPEGGKNPVAIDILRTKIVSILKQQAVANDITGYAKAPPSCRIWGGATVQNNDMQALLPWIDWAYYLVKNNA